MTELKSVQNPIASEMDSQQNDLLNEGKSGAAIATATATAEPGGTAGGTVELMNFEMTGSESNPNVVKPAVRERRRLISEEKQEAERVFQEKLRKARIKYKGCHELPEDLDNDVREAMEEDIRRKRLDYQRKRRQAMSDEMKQKDREYKRQYMRKRLDGMSEEQNRQRLLRRAELRRLKFENMTEGEKEAQREAKRLRQKRRLERMSQEEREEKNARRRLVAQQFRATWDEDEKERRAIKRRIIKKRWVDNMTEDQRQSYFERRSQVNKRYRQRLANERSKPGPEDETTTTTDSQNIRTPDTGNSNQINHPSSTSTIDDTDKTSTNTKLDEVFAVV